MTVNDKIVDNYNVETKISEIQNFLIPSGYLIIQLFVI